MVACARLGIQICKRAGNEATLNAAAQLCLLRILRRVLLSRVQRSEAALGVQHAAFFPCSSCVLHWGKETDRGNQQLCTFRTDMKDCDIRAYLLCMYNGRMYH